MNLKEAFRYQSEVQTLMDEANSTGSVIPTKSFERASRYIAEISIGNGLNTGAAL